MELSTEYYVTPEEVRRAIGAIPLKSMVRHLRRKGVTKRVGRCTYIVLHKLREQEPDWHQAVMRLRFREELGIELILPGTSESARS